MRVAIAFVTSLQEPLLGQSRKHKPTKLLSELPESKWGVLFLPMPQSAWVQGLITVGVGAVSGGITNAVAVWMLFHPYEAWGVGWLKLQGAIPKNKPRLAKSIGKTVGQRLLTEEDLARQLSAPGLREAFDRAINVFLDRALNTPRGARPLGGRRRGPPRAGARGAGVRVSPAGAPVA